MSSLGGDCFMKSDVILRLFLGGVHVLDLGVVDLRLAVLGVLAFGET